MIAWLFFSFLSGCFQKSNVASSTRPTANQAKSASNAETVDSDSLQSPFSDLHVESTHSRQPDDEVGIQLEDVASTRGITHTYENGETGRCLIVETIGGGAGWLDYDLDGRWDVALNQGGDPTALSVEGQPTDRLFRQLESQFVDATKGSRLNELNYSQGIAIGDFNNDGLDDVYITNVYANTFWMNCGDGTFLEIASLAHVDDDKWGVSSAWSDLDLDGDLDLYVCNYVQFDPRHPKICFDNLGRESLCNPGSLLPAADVYYVNQGDGTFLESSQQLGLVGDGNRALGVAIADFSGDALPDIYVANDTTENFLFVQQADGTFLDEAVVRGCAVNREGATQASMGVAVGDYDANGWLDIYSTHYLEESNTLYANFGSQGFQDVTALEGMHLPTLGALGFGTVFCDVDDNDTLEILVVNGHVNNASWNPFKKMKAQIFTRTNNRYRILEQSGSYFAQLRFGRGLAMADYDQDGDVDFLIVNENDPVALLENRSIRGSWLNVQCIGICSNRRGLGCRVTVQKEGWSRTVQLAGGTSYAVSHQPLIHFGLGSLQGPVELTCHWPSGALQRLSAVEINQELTIIEPEAN